MYTPWLINGWRQLKIVGLPVSSWRLSVISEIWYTLRLVAEEMRLNDVFNHGNVYPEKDSFKS